MSITPDTKDWTWVLERPCPECGFDPGGQGFDDLPGLVHDTAMAWSEVLARPDAVRRPRPDVWSPLEYACHVRDVHVLFAERLRLMLDEDEPTFANWDQDATAVESDYGSQDPTTVAVELIEVTSTDGDWKPVILPAVLRTTVTCTTRSATGSLRYRVLPWASNSIPPAPALRPSMAAV